MEKIDANSFYGSLRRNSSIGRLILVSSREQIEVLINVWSVIHGNRDLILKSLDMLNTNLLQGKIAARILMGLQAD